MAIVAHEADGSSSTFNAGGVGCIGPDGLYYFLDKTDGDGFYRLEADLSVTTLAAYPISDTPNWITPAPEGNVLVSMGDELVYEYDIDTDTWDGGGTRATSLGAPVNDACCGRVGDVMWVIGGSGGTGLQIQRYDLVADTWTIRALEAPGTTLGGNVIAYPDDDHLFVLTSDGNFVYQWVYRPSLETYEDFDYPPSPGQANSYASAARIPGTPFAWMTRGDYEDASSGILALNLASRKWQVTAIDDSEFLGSIPYFGALVAGSSGRMYAAAIAGFNDVLYFDVTGAVLPWANRYEQWGARTNRLRGDMGPIVPTLSGLDIPFLVANDRHQTVLVTRDGSGGTTPAFRRWSAGPLAWGDALALGGIDDFVPFYALDEHGRPVAGTVELHVFTAPKGQVVNVVDGVEIAFVPRPTEIGARDGGVSPSTRLGFTAQVWGYQNPQVADVRGGRTTGIVLSEAVPVSLAASDVASGEWPNVRTVWLPCVLEHRIRQVRVRITDLRLCGIANVDLYGSVIDWGNR